MIEDDPAPRAVPRALPALRALWPWALLALVAGLGWSELRAVDFVRVRALVRETNSSVVALLIAGTTASLALGGFYDVAALGGRDLPPTATRRWSVGVIAFAWSNFPPSGRSPVRRSACGSTGRWRHDRESAAALVTILATFVAGLGVWTAAVFVPLPGI
jgi:hypothetical protein